MPSGFRQFFRQWLGVTVPSELGLVVGTPAVVAIVPWLPPDARVPLSKIIHNELEKLESNRGSWEDPLFAELKSICPNRPLTETLEEVQRVMIEFKEKQWRAGGTDGGGVPIADLVADTFSKINEYSSILEPITQAIPLVPPVVWGAFSMLMKMAMDDAEMGAKLMHFINSYMEASEIYTTYRRLYQHSQGQSSRKVRDLIGLLEEDIRKFASSARRCYFNKKNSVSRILGSTTVPFSAEFQPICDGIQQRTSSLRLAIEAAKQDERKRDEILKWISKVPYQDAHTNSARKREFDTCGWLHKKEHFLKWMHSSVSSVLWVHGNAGFGKTILMSSVVDYLQEVLPNGSPRHKHVAYFYCNHDKKEMLDTPVILGSILKQIVSSLTGIPGKVVNSFEHHKHLGKPGVLHLDAIRELLIASLQEASSAVFILVDGLDECDMAIREELLETLMPLTLASGPTPSKMAKICIFSRPYDDIREGLTDKFLEIPILKTDNRNDMVKFLSSKINSSRYLTKALGSESGLRTQVIQVLVNKAGGMFIWINLQQMALCRERDPRSIKRYLKDLPNSQDMDESYLRLIQLILSESPGNRRLAETVLGWVLCAVRPLSVGELTGVLCFLGLFKKGLEELKRDIIQVCHGLIHIEKHNDVEYVRFIHFSAHQFLCSLLGQSNKSNLRRNSFGLHDMGPDTSRGRGESLAITISQAHFEMAQTCMNCISQDGLNKALLDADEAYNCHRELDLLKVENPFLLYASQAWVEHFQATDDNTRLTETCLKLFRKRQNLELAFQLFWFQKFVERFPRGSTPLHIASYFGLSHIISSLLEDQDDTQGLIADKQYRTPIYWAAYHGDLASLEKLGLATSRDCKLRGVTLQQALGEALLAAIEGDQVDLITNLLSRGADPNVHIRLGKNALFHATLKGDSNLPVVQQLVEAGAKIEPEAPTASPLEAAVMAGALAITRYLISCNIDVNVRSHDPPGHPLRIAVIAGQHEMAELLLISGADIALAAENELIEVASMMGDYKMIDIILQHKPSLSLEREGSDLTCVLSHDHSTLGSDLACVLSRDRSTPIAPSKSKVVQIRGLRTGFRHALRLIRMGSMSQETIESAFTRVQRIIEKKFDALDFDFLEAVESIFLELVDELLRIEPTVLLLEPGSHGFAGALIYMKRKSQGRQQTEYYERLLQTVGAGTVKLIDGGCQGHFRTVRLNTEKKLIESIEKGQGERIEVLFAEVEVSMHIGVVMERHALWVRGSARTYLAGIMTFIPEQGSTRFAKFLEGVVVSGLNSEGDRARNWRKMVMFIEIAYCAYASGYHRLYPQIQLKLAGLRKALKDNSQISPDGIMVDQLGTIMHGGRLDWQWDADEDPWWHRRG